MPAPDHPQRRNREVDTDQRGHSLQRRGGSRTGDEGSRERGVGERDEGLSGDRQTSLAEVGDRQTGAAQDFGSVAQGNAQRRGTPDRAYGDRMATPTYQSQGNPRTGSQRGADSDLGISGEAGGQFGDLHGQRPSDAQRAGYHADDREAGRSAHDYRFGSRRGSGHGSRRREDPRVRDES